MKTDVDQLSTYKSVHLNKTNVKTHFIGVPIIIWSLMVLLSLVELPISIGGSGYELTMAVVCFTGIIIYYFLLNAKLAIGQILFFVPLLYIANIVAQQQHAVWVAISAFVVGWVIQFIGHHYEKAKPAFVDDLNQLIIGPFFLMAEVFFMLGAQKELENKVTAIAITKRREFEANKNVS